MRPFETVSMNKFGAVRTNGYASKREAQYAADLTMRKAATNGDVLDWLEQVPIKLQGGVKYVVDFMIIKRDGTVRFVEVKGHETQAWRNKMRQLAESHPEIFARLEVVR
jgi:hypothetical protein